jgi:zinc transport system substrate-binding protein
MLTILKKALDMRRMPRLLLYPLLVSVLLSAVLASAACSSRSQGHGRLDVVVSILPLAEFVEAVGGDRVNVSVMVPPGASPHTYEPTPSQLVQVAEAEMFVKMGSGIEFELVWMDKIAQTNRKMLVVDGSKGIELMAMAAGDEEHEGPDPHIWTSIGNAQVIVTNIYGGLAQLEPDEAGQFARNRDAYLQKLRDLDKEIRDQFARSDTKEFIVFHSGWGYFANDYGLTQIAIEIGGKEPSATDIARIVDEARNKNIKVVFMSPQFNQQSAKVIASSIGGVVVPIDNLAKEYVDNLRKVAAELAKVRR